MPVAVGMYLYLTVDAGLNHTTKRLLNERTRLARGKFSGRTALGDVLEYEYFFASAEPNNQQPIDFSDVTTRHATFEIAGGMCNSSLGLTTLEVTYPTCTSTWKQTVLR